MKLCLNRVWGQMKNRLVFHLTPNSLLGTVIAALFRLGQPALLLGWSKRR
jgi:hypothetical protein